MCIRDSRYSDQSDEKCRIFSGGAVMIKKLRIKLIVASMISLFLVLFIIGGIAGVLNYRKIAEDADRILEVLEKNAGHFPKMIPGNEKGDRHGISPEIPYESRYFSVLLDEKGEVILTDTSKIVSIDVYKRQPYVRFGTDGFGLLFSHRKNSGLNAAVKKI